MIICEIVRYIAAGFFILLLFYLLYGIFHSIGKILKDGEHNWYDFADRPTDETYNIYTDEELPPDA